MVMRKIRTDQKGVTPIIATIMMMVIAIVSVSILFAYVTPTVNRINLESGYALVYKEFQDLDDGIENNIQSYIFNSGNAPNETMVLNPIGGKITEDNSGDIWIICMNKTGEKISFTHNSDGTITINRAGTESISLEIRYFNYTLEKPAIKYANGGIIRSLNANNRVLVIKSYDGTTILAKVWVFSTPGLSYSIDSNAGTFHIWYYNAGISGDYPSGISAVKYPQIYVNDNSIEFTIYDINFYGSSRGSSIGSETNLFFETTGYSLLASENTVSVSVTVFGNDAELWAKTLSEEYDIFSYFPDDNMAVGSSVASHITINYAEIMMGARR